MTSPIDPDPQAQDQTFPTDNPDVIMTEVEVEEVPQQNPNSESHSQSKILTLKRPQDLDIKQSPLQLDSNQSDPDAFYLRSPQNNTMFTFSRRGRGKKQGPKGRPGTRGRKQREKKLQILREKNLQILRETLKPIPFVPVKNLDFERHEKLLKWLNLWDFVHIEFDRSFRVDLLDQLIANYSPKNRCSWVNDVRVMVNRADLARALKLPVKKSELQVTAEEPPVASEESIAFIEGFLSNWVLLHEDTWMMPTEVLNLTKAIKEGQFGKVDWAGLIWLMVETELAQAPNLGNCYYASHLQFLIKSQREELFLVKEQDCSILVDLKEDEEEEEEEDGDGDVKMGGEGDFQGRGLEEQNIQLCLGQDNVEKVDDGKHNVEKVDDGQENVEKVDDGQENVEKVDDGQDNVEKVEYAQDNVEKVDDGQHSVEQVDDGQDSVEKVDDGQDNVEEVSAVKEQVGFADLMGSEECKEEEPARWLLDGKDNASESFLRPCNLGEVKDLACGDKRNKDMDAGEGGMEEGQEEEEDEEEEQEGGFPFLPKSIPFEGLSSGSLNQDMEGVQLPQSMPLRDHFSAEFLSRDDSRLLPGSSSLFGSGHKREISHDNDNYHHALNGNGNKRLRTDGPWDSKLPGDFEMCMEQIQHWMGKARMMYVTKEQACEQSAMNQQILLDELQQRDAMIDHLHKVKNDEQQKRQMEVYRLESELRLMRNVLDGYRKALKETHKAFSEYREQRPQAEEPLYRDVPGSGGLVLSTMELEKQRLKQEEEEKRNRLVIEKKIKDFEVGWISKFEAYSKSVELFSNRLLDAKKEVKLLNELLDAKKEVKLLNEQLSKRRTPKTPESVPNEL